MQSHFGQESAASNACLTAEVVPEEVDAEDESQFPPILTPEDDPRTWDIGRTNHYVGRCRFWHVVRVRLPHIMVMYLLDSYHYLITQVLHHPTNKTDWMVCVAAAQQRDRDKRVFRHPPSCRCMYRKLT
jgi:hypothetical protein